MNYPGGIAPKGAKEGNEFARKSKKGAKIAAGNRGMGFEEDINLSNEYYKEKGLCLVTKRPTPINVVKVDYTHGAIITQAYFETQSTTDYNGVYRGRYLDFEAKSTISKTALSLSNIKPQQIDHLERVLEQKGIAFFLVHFSAYDEAYFVPANEIISFYKEKPRASIPYAWMKEHGKLVKQGYRLRYDYLPWVDFFFPAK